jgi:hypothetical protein
MMGIWLTEALICEVNVVAARCSQGRVMQGISNFMLCMQAAPTQS